MSPWVCGRALYVFLSKTQRLRGSFFARTERTDHRTTDAGVIRVACQKTLGDRHEVKVVGIGFQFLCEQEA